MLLDRIPDAPLVVAYSGGKDSLAVLDLCMRAGRRVEAFLMSFLPGMDYTRYWIEYAERRWRVKVREYQHPLAVWYLRRGVFCVEGTTPPPAITLKDIEAKARADSGMEWIGYGYKAADCIDRRVMLKTWPNGIYEKWHKFAPLYDWKQSDVLAYLNRRCIEIPTIFGRRMTGVDLTPESLEWLRDAWPDDYARVLKVFPYAAGQAHRAARIREQRQAERECRKASARAKRAAVADQPSPVQSADAL